MGQAQKRQNQIMIEETRHAKNKLFLPALSHGLSHFLPYQYIY
jgi:hypothetical protein